ncbi:helix-turn-helix transcriptional regulator [Nonomuraea sp. NPDC049129]|uniref:helix-turn-helix domain-containing protein n=1 Tax=Nonomuraea sp. NPDC049129 TaxID=3155272 RepID=UPI0033F006FE
MAARSGISQSKISKIETGEVPPSAVDVERILRALNASPEVTEEITALPRLANTQFLDLRSTLRRGLCARRMSWRSNSVVWRRWRFFPISG